ncbi:Phosphopantetheinyl transferase [Rheinheimera pacifica]|uniref:Phosphopantetheinyl transferase n=1 Tax=Rheinheimera pacifica TaxID=173990 RepID=A0A1H6JTY7_9GAMM|nr:hypothetical protein [Rheinheimera pacifica]SEH65993.1 Phosphopantetheinyl transferase [Rheinheimera pacifica]
MAVLVAQVKKNKQEIAAHFMISLAYRLQTLSVKDCRVWLHDNEWQYCLTLSNKRAREFCNGRALIRQLLLQQSGVAVAEIQITLPSAQAPAMYVGGQAVALSISHSRQAVAVVYSPQQPVGVDLEYIKVRDFVQLSGQFAALKTATDSATFYQSWTAAEAYSKFSKQPLLAVLAQPLPQNIQLTHLPLPGYMLCLCYQHADTKLKITGDVP